VIWYTEWPVVGDNKRFYAYDVEFRLAVRVLVRTHTTVLDSLHRRRCWRAPCSRLGLDMSWLLLLLERWQ